MVGGLFPVQHILGALLVGHKKKPKVNTKKNRDLIKADLLFVRIISSDHVWGSKGVKGDVPQIQVSVEKRVNFNLHAN